MNITIDNVISYAMDSSIQLPKNGTTLPFEVNHIIDVAEEIDRTYSDNDCWLLDSYTLSVNN